MKSEQNKPLPELERCKFCGSSNTDAEFALSGDGRVSAGCMDCGACGPDASTAAEAVAKWNTRARPQEAAAGWMDFAVSVAEAYRRDAVNAIDRAYFEGRMGIAAPTGAAAAEGEARKIWESLPSGKSAKDVIQAYARALSQAATKALATVKTEIEADREKLRANGMGYKSDGAGYTRSIMLIDEARRALSPQTQNKE
jgi:hypothetical protein